jgi:nitrite reductase (NO-forming)
MNKTRIFTIIFSTFLSILLFGCAPQQVETVPVTRVESQPDSSPAFDAEFTLKTIAEGGKLLYIGVGGDIDGIINPDLAVQTGATVHITLINGDGMVHDLFIPDLDQKADYVRKLGEQKEIIFKVGNIEPGVYVYYCTLPGHRKAGQEGKLIVSNP